MQKNATAAIIAAILAAATMTAAAAAWAVDAAEPAGTTADARHMTPQTDRIMEADTREANALEGESCDTSHARGRHGHDFGHNIRHDDGHSGGLHAGRGC